MRSCLSVLVIFSYSLTLIDALDTLAVMGNYSEFRRVTELLEKTLDFDRDINVSVFETNIRGVCFKCHTLFLNSIEMIFYIDFLKFPMFQRDFCSIITCI